MKNIIPPIILSFCLALLPGGAKGALETFDQLNHPFDEFNTSPGKYVPSIDWLHGDTFFGVRKQTVVARVVDETMAYFNTAPLPIDRGANILEIGTGRGYGTTQLARYLYDKRLSEPDPTFRDSGDGGTALDVINPYTPGVTYGGTTLFTIDNWGERFAETIATHGVTIPARQAVGSNPAIDLVAETDVPLMMSNLLNDAVNVTGSTDNLIMNLYLDMVQLPIKGFNAATTATDYLEATSSTPFFDPIANVSDLEEIMDDFNGSNPFAMVVVDTDTRDEFEFANLLLRIYNVLPIGGAMVLDDIGWSHQDDGGTRHMENGLDLFLTEINPYLFDDPTNTGNPVANAPDLRDTGAQFYHTVSYDAGGNPENLEDYTSAVLSTELYGGLARPVLEYHDVWSTGAPWMAVFRKVSVGGDVNSVPVDYTGLGLTA